jgi:hypothetical protein
LPLRVFGPQMKDVQVSSRDGAANTGASGASRASHHGMPRRHVALDLTFQAVTETKFTPRLSVFIKHPKVMTRTRFRENPKPILVNSSRSIPWTGASDSRRSSSPSPATTSPPAFGAERSELFLLHAPLLVYVIHGSNNVDI